MISRQTEHIPSPVHFKNIGSFYAVIPVRRKARGQAFPCKKVTASCAGNDRGFGALICRSAHCGIAVPVSALAVVNHVHIPAIYDRKILIAVHRKRCFVLLSAVKPVTGNKNGISLIFFKIHTVVRYRNAYRIGIGIIAIT